MTADPGYWYSAWVTLYQVEFLQLLSNPQDFLSPPQNPAMLPSL